ncbi:F-box only protein 7-like isoform X2 [Orbicella faveolata]|uniref:F-box only protein 7-like isoform X2 n=1 Tax=Orbicella faveolata TaxID=48498 RepID=UPI0009E1D695|nr:F-box only protein 7-like isoform X2 [Orbicella faveolata]
MKLRAVLHRRRELLELHGDAITLSDCREAVRRKFGLRTGSFNLSLNGQDVLDNDSVLLTDLGIVHGDLIYILQNSGEQGNALASQNTPGSSRDTLHTDQQVPCTSAEHVSDPAQHSTVSLTLEQQHDNQGKEKARKSETEQAHRYSTGSVSSLGSSILLCREGIPQTLEDLYKAMDVGTIHEAAWVVIHVLMMETGYICASEDSMDKTEVDDSSRVVPCKDWKKGGITRIMYTHLSCPGLTCSLTCTSLGPYIMVHGLADSVPKSEIYQCKLQPTDFVRGNVDLKTNGASSVYYNLHRLSRLFKDQVAYPLLSFMRAALGLPQLCGFMAVPAEVKVHILLWVNTIMLFILECCFSIEC